MKLGHSPDPVSSGQGNLVRARSRAQVGRAVGWRRERAVREVEREWIKVLQYLTSRLLAREVMNFTAASAVYLALQSSQGAFLHG